MLLFNFDEDKNEELEETNCYCEECSELVDLEMAANYTDIALQSKSTEELEAVLYDLVKNARVEGIKQYIFEMINIQAESLINIEQFEKLGIKSTFDDEYDNGGLWLDRL